MNILAFARELPKVELHCHLEGAARPWSDWNLDAVVEWIGQRSQQA